MILLCIAALAAIAFAILWMIEMMIDFEEEDEFWDSFMHGRGDDDDDDDD